MSLQIVAGACWCCYTLTLLAALYAQHVYAYLIYVRCSYVCMHFKHSHRPSSEVWIYQIVCHKQLCTKIPHRYGQNLIESHNFTLTKQTLYMCEFFCCCFVLFFVLFFVLLFLVLLLSRRHCLCHLIPIDVLMCHCHTFMQC